MGAVGALSKHQGTPQIMKTDAILDLPTETASLNESLHPVLHPPPFCKNIIIIIMIIFYGEMQTYGF